MKFIFIMALLTNILFFLWEYNATELHSAQSSTTENGHALKHIFLLSELPKETKKNRIALKSDPIEKQQEIIVSELKIAEQSIPEIVSETSETIIPAKLPADNSKIESVTADNNSALEQKNKPSVPIISPDIKEESHTEHEPKPENKLIVVSDAIEKTTPTEEPEQSLQTEKTFCYEVGSFQNKEKVKQWLALNKKAINSSQLIEKNSHKSSRYLVYYPAPESYQQSKDQIKTFKKMGIDEVWLFRQGALKGAISFGLFRQEKRALTLQKKLTDKGLDIKIYHNTNTNPSYYVKISTQEESTKKTFNLSDSQTLSHCEFKEANNPS